MSAAFIPGSFDPITLGHIDIIERAAKLFDKVYIVLAINSEKDYLFSAEKRLELAKAATAHIENAEVIFCDGIVVELAQNLGVNVLVKGIRNAKDYEYESNIANINKGLAPEIETLYMPASEEFSRISSTAVRKLISYGMPTEQYVGKTVARLIEGYTKL